MSIKPALFVDEIASLWLNEVISKLHFADKITTRFDENRDVIIVINEDKFLTFKYDTSTQSVHLLNTLNKIPSSLAKIELFKTEFFLNEVVSLEFSEECLYKLYTKDSEFYVNIDRLSRHCEDKLEKIFNLVMQKASFYSRELEEAWNFLLYKISTKISGDLFWQNL